MLFLEIDGLAHDVLVRAMRDGSAPTMAAWLRSGSHSMIEWECDWSSQTGAMQSGILQGSNWDMPGFPLVGEGYGRKRSSRTARRTRGRSRSGIRTARACCTRTGPARRTSSRVTHLTR